MSAHGAGAGAGVARLPVCISVLGVRFDPAHQSLGVREQLDLGIEVLGELVHLESGSGR